MEDETICDKCEEIDISTELVWIDCEDFSPLDKDNFSEEKYLKAIEKGYSALCESCYKEECCK